ncbi:MAG: response regulator transcription factor [Prevotella sp.]|nr:response regulator transcription factor [Prevotella sp.]
MSKTLRAIVVEDERMPRLTLLQKLEDLRPQVEVVDACDNYDAALQSILRHRPDLLLLDIQLQGRNSMQLLHELQTTMPLPHVIFTTAYNERQYLMNAIKLSAVDYLLKPIDKNELALAIGKVSSKSLTAGATEPVTTGKIEFRTASGKLYVDADDIAYIRADGNYAQVETFHHRETVFDSLASLERQLNASVFVRIDRSLIVNIQRLYKLDQKRRLCVLMSTGGTELELTVSKNGMDVLSRVMQEGVKS